MNAVESTRPDWRSRCHAAAQVPATSAARGTGTSWYQTATSGLLGSQMEKGASKAVETQIQSASKSVGDALDAQFKKFFP